MGVQMTLLYPGLHSFGYMPRSGITRWYDRSIFSFLRNFHHAFFKSESSPSSLSSLSGHTSMHASCLWLLLVGSQITSIVRCLLPALSAKGTGVQGMCPVSLMSLTPRTKSLGLFNRKLAGSLWVTLSLPL
jgi:hypothetical protein